jgi:hypothetical protein
MRRLAVAFLASTVLVTVALAGSPDAPVGGKPADEKLVRLGGCMVAVPSPSGTGRDSGVSGWLTNDKDWYADCVSREPNPALRSKLAGMLRSVAPSPLQRRRGVQRDPATLGKGD